MTATKVPLFKIRRKDCSVSARSGKTYNFSHGRFATRDPAEIEELTKLAAKGNFGIYIDPKEPDFDYNPEGAVNALKEAIIAEYLQSQAAMKGDKDFGNSPLTTAVNQQAISHTAASELNGNPLAVDTRTHEEKAAEGGENKALSVLEQMKAKAGKAAATDKPE